MVITVICGVEGSIRNWTEKEAIEYYRSTRKFEQAKRQGYASEVQNDEYQLLLKSPIDGKTEYRSYDTETEGPHFPQGARDADRTVYGFRPRSNYY
jgi:hypothetical protein